MKKLVASGALVALLSGCSTVHWDRHTPEQLAVNSQATNGCAFAGVWRANRANVAITVRPDGLADIVVDHTPYDMPPIVDTYRQSGRPFEEGGRRLFMLDPIRLGFFLSDDGLSLRGSRMGLAKKVATYPCPLED